MDISLICFESNIVFVFLTDNSYTVTLTKNYAGEMNCFGPGQPIIVKCSVPNPALLWRIHSSTFSIERKDVLFLPFSLRPRGPSYFYLNSSVGRLHFYRNETYVGSPLDLSHSFINSELHMRFVGVVDKELDHFDFFDIECIDPGRHTFKKIAICGFRGMLNIV